MTRITIKQEDSLRILICNGRRVAFEGRIERIENVSAGRWEGVAGGEPFQIIGGRAAGGASNEWFVKWGPCYGEKYVPVKSAVEAINAIELC